jgi:hypothetical protein
LNSRAFQASTNAREPLGTEITLTRCVVERDLLAPMARIFIAERTLQGRSLSSFGALACPPGQHLDHEDHPGRRKHADAGRPVVRW